MARMRWFTFGLVFSIIIFLALYFLVYTRLTSGDPTVVLKLGKMDVSSWKPFLSNLKNIIIASLIAGFLLGLLTGRGSRTRPN